MTRNPYGPPEANVEDPAAPLPGPKPPAPSVRLYSPAQITAASFLGTPIAAAWFAASNFRALAQPLQAQRMIWAGVVATVLVMGIAFLLPDRVPNLALPLAYSVAIRVIAEPLFGTIAKNHLSAGGRLGSWWRIVGISLLLTLVVLAGVVAVVILLAQFGISTE